MISSFLKKDKEDKNSFIFNFVQFSNLQQPDSNLCDFIRTSILKSYMEEDLNKDFLKKYDLEKIKWYIKNTIIADNKNRFDKNVREGDLGEVIAALIVKEIQGKLPFNKMRFKFNKNKSVFGTDIVAINSLDDLNTVYYYEVKTRFNGAKKESDNYITVIAYNSLNYDYSFNSNNVLNFWSTLLKEKGDLEHAEKILDLVVDSSNINPAFEIFIITDKNLNDSNLTEMLNELNSLPPTLKPLTVTFVLFNNLKTFVEEVWNDIETYGANLIKA